MKLPMLSSLLAAGLISGCSVVGPNFTSPSMVLAERYAYQHGGPLEQAAQDSWWLALDDPLLNTIVERGLAQNLDIQAAIARIRQAHALVGTTGNAALLSGSVQAQVTAQGIQNQPWTRQDILQSQPSFVIDLFGGEKRRRESAEADLVAAQFDAATARLAFQQAVVLAYLDMRYFERAIVVQNRSITNRRKVVNVLSERAKLGEATQFDLKRAQAELASARAGVPNLKTGQATAALQIATLLATQAQDVLEAVKKHSKGQPVPKADVNTSVPAALLQNRPDIRAAEARLASAVAQIGVSTADLYPSLRIGGTITATTVSSVSIGPALTIPLLDKAVRKARLKAAKARALEAEILWRRSVVLAMEEVQTGLVRLEQSDARAARLKTAVGIYRQAGSLTREAFDLGSVTVVELLSTEDNLTAAELQLAEARRNHAAAWARLNVAIGQGWQQGPAYGCCVAEGQTARASH